MSDNNDIPLPLYLDHGTRVLRVTVGREGPPSFTIFGEDGALQFDLQEEDWNAILAKMAERALSIGPVVHKTPGPFPGVFPAASFPTSPPFGPLPGHPSPQFATHVTTNTSGTKLLRADTDE